MEKSSQTKWCVILNPHAGSGRGQKDRPVILKKLALVKISYELKVSEYPNHIALLAAEAIAEGFRNLIVAGGDGSLNELVNGIFTQTVCSPEDITVAIIPVGTGNDWIRTFGIPRPYKEALRMVKRGKTMKQDIGRIRFSENGQNKTRYFANMAGFGFDAMVAHKTNILKNKGRSGIILYLQSLAWSYLNYSATKMQIVIDGQKIDETIFLVSIGIGKYNGGGMMQAPAAVPDNGFFQVGIIRKIGLLGILRNIRRLYSGTYVKDYRVSTFKARELSIASARNIAGEVDGEALGESQFEIDILPRCLKVVYNPEKYLKC